jgi:hypothetical protein
MRHDVKRVMTYSSVVPNIDIRSVDTFIQIPEYVSNGRLARQQTRSGLEVKINILPTPGRDSNPAIQLLSSRMVAELYQTGF